MLNRIFQKQTPRIFLGTIAVAPRSDFKSEIERWTLFNRNTEDLDDGVRRSLEEIFTLPSVESVSNPKPSDLAIDVIVPDFQGGEFALGDLIYFPLAVLWRPRVKIASRLYYIKSNKTKMKFLITKRMAFGEFLGRAFSWRGFFRLRPLFDSSDIDYLTSLACLELLQKVKKAI